MFDKKEETKGAVKNQLAGRKKGRVTKETTKKMKKCNKKNTIEIGKSEDEEEKMTKIKWKNLGVHHLIAISREMDKKLKKQAR